MNGNKETGGAINGPGGADRGAKHQVDTVSEQRAQGEAGRDAWHCGFVSAVVLAVTQQNPDCYIYQAAV